MQHEYAGGSIAGSARGSLGAALGQFQPNAVAKQQPQVAEELGRLERMVEHLEKTASVFAPRLSGVLRPVNEAPAKTLGEIDSLVPLANALRQLSARVQNVQLDLMGLSERIEL